MLQSTIQIGLDYIAPIKTKTTYISEPPWISTRLKSLIKDRQSALRLGMMAEFRRLRNAVNRGRKICRSKYYDGKVKHLKECSPADWWKEVKRLSGKDKATSAHNEVLDALKRLEGQEQSSDIAIANMVNEALLTPMRYFSVLLDQPDHSSTSVLEPPLIVTSDSVLKKLSALNPTKAQGPDGIPGRLLNENAD